MQQQQQQQGDEDVDESVWNVNVHGAVIPGWMPAVVCPETGVRVVRVLEQQQEQEEATETQVGMSLLEGEEMMWNRRGWREIGERVLSPWLCRGERDADPGAAQPPLEVWLHSAGPCGMMSACRAWCILQDVLRKFCAALVTHVVAVGIGHECFYSVRVLFERERGVGSCC